MVVNYRQHPLACPNAAHNPKPITAPSLLLRQAATATPHTHHHHHLHQKLCQSLRNTIHLVLSSSRQRHHQRKLLQGSPGHCSTSSPCHLTAVPSPSPSVPLSSSVTWTQSQTVSPSPFLFTCGPGPHEP
jgi:hypothetical protein